MKIIENKLNIAKQKLIDSIFNNSLTEKQKKDIYRAFKIINKIYKNITEE